MDNVYDVPQAAEVMGTSTKTIYRLLQSRKLGHSRDGYRGRYRIRRSDIDRYLAKTAVKPRGGY